MTPDMPVYPGKGQPVIRPAATIDKNGYREMFLQLDGHTGTHIDAPAHMLPDGRMLDDFPASKFTGKAVVIHVPGNVHSIDLEFLEPCQEQIQSSDFVLFHTGWGDLWGSAEYLRGFPVLSEEAAKWLVTLALKGIGLDAISVDPVESETYAIHHILFNADMVIIENLVFPPELDSSTGTFYCFPLKFNHADGSPVRAVLEIAHP
jgi:arylformamidase